jgi:hypothetical protein
MFFRAPSVAEHCRRVANCCVTASENTVQGRSAYLLEVAALLHELGRIGLPDTILFHEASLSSENQKLIASYDRVGLEILRDIFGCEDLNNLLHAFVNGKTEIGAVNAPAHVIKAANVLRIADRFDSLTHHRNGQRFRSNQDTFVLLRNDAGKDLDEELLQRFIQSVAVDDEHSVSNQWPLSEDSSGGPPTEEYAVLAQLRRILSQLNRESKPKQPPLPSDSLSGR